MTTAIVMSVFSLLLLLVPVAVAVAVAVLMWFVWPDARPIIEESLPAGLAFAISALGAQIVLRAGMATCWLAAFVGPKNLVRDHLAASIRSRTATFAASAGVLNLVLIVVMRFPFGDARSPIIIVVTAALLALDTPRSEACSGSRGRVDPTRSSQGCRRRRRRWRTGRGPYVDDRASPPRAPSNRSRTPGDTADERPMPRSSTPGSAPASSSSSRHSSARRSRRAGRNQGRSR